MPSACRQSLIKRDYRQALLLKSEMYDVVFHSLSSSSAHTSLSAMKLEK